MAYHVLTSKGTEITRSTVHKLSEVEHLSEDIMRMKNYFTKSMESTIGNYILFNVNGDADIYEELFEDFECEMECIKIEYDKYGDKINNINDIVENRETPEILHDKLLGMRLSLPFDGELRPAIIKSRKRSVDETLIGEDNTNPMLDTRIYEVDFDDGNYYDYSANVILENLYEQVDDFGRSTSTLADIVDHRKNEDVIEKKDGWYEMKNSKARKRVITTK